MTINTPKVYVQEVDPSTWLTSDNRFPSEIELQAELNRRLQKFVGGMNDSRTMSHICQICEDFHRELRYRYPDYFGQFGFDVTWDENSKTCSISRYAKNIRTLLAAMGYMMYALDCPEDAETYSCSAGRFCMRHGRAIQLPDED